MREKGPGREQIPRESGGGQDATAHDRGYSGSVLDITERVRAEETLRHSEEQFQALFNQITGGIAQTDLTGRFTLVNDRYCDLVGRSREELLTLRMHDITHPDDLSANAEQFRTLVQGGPSFVVETRYLRPDGSMVWAHNDVSAVGDSGGQVSHVVAAVADITERKQAEDALRERAERFRTLSEAVPAMVWICRPDGYLLHLNQRWIEYTGQTEKEYQGYGWADTMHPEDRPRILAQWKRCTDTGELYEGEVRYRHHDGQYRWHYFRGVPLREGGRITSWYGASLDIQEKKVGENALRESEERFDRFMQHLPGLAWIKDAQGRYVYANDAGQKAFQMPQESLYGKTDEEVFPPEVAAQFRENDRRALAGGTGAQVVETLEHQDGLLRHSLVSKFPIPGPDGRTALIGGIAIDITDRKRAESLLVEQNRLMEHIASGSPLDETLTELCLAVPKLNPRARACVLLANEQRNSVSGSITPDVAPAFGAALQNAPIPIALTHPSGAETPLLPNDLCIGACGEAIYTGQPVTCVDVAKDERWSKTWRDLCVSCGIFAGYSRPIMGADGLPLASLFLCFGEPHQPDAWELKLAEFGAHVASIAIERERIESERQTALVALGDGERRLAAELSNMRRLQDLSARLIRADELHPLLQEILSASADLTGTDKGNIQLFDSSTGALRIVAHQGLGKRLIEHFAEHGWVATCDAAMRQVQRVIVEDVAKEPSVQGTVELEIVLEDGIRAIQSTPLITRDGRFVGMLSNHFRFVHRPSDSALRCLDLLARQAADLIERKQAEGTLRESEERFRSLVTVITDVPWVTDSTGAFIAPQPAFEAYTGQSWEQHRGFGWADALHPDDREKIKAIWLKACEAKTFYESHGRIWHAPSRQWRYFLARATPLFNADGSVREWVGTCTDVQELKQTEEALRRLNDELEQRVAERTRDLVQSQGRLRALASEVNLAEQRERKRLAGELHDYLAQLLVLGRLNLGQVRRAGLPAKTDEMVKETEEVLSQALTYCRTLIAELSPPILHEFGLPTALRWLGERMQQHGLTVTVQSEIVNLPLPENQAVLLFQSTRELLMNVSKHAGAGEAWLSLEQRDGTLRLEVGDRGKGFEITEAAAAAAAKFGLFSIRERMRALGGSFEIQSAPGQGTTATLLLPMAARDERETRDKRDSQDQERRPDSSLSRVSPVAPVSPFSQAPVIRVLLVDDHAMIRQGLRSVLESYPDVEIVGEACNGEQAVAAAEGLQPTVVLMDINMPTMNGIDATGAITARFPGIIVIGLSVQTDAVNEEAMKEAGAARLINKEAAVDELYQVIRDALRGSGR